MGDVVGGQFVDEAMDDVSPARLHFITFCYDFRVFFGGVLVETFMLDLSQNDAFEEASNFVFGEVVRKLAHLIEKVDIFIENERKIRL